MKKNGGVTLITGSNGGIGQYIASYLLSQGRRDIICHYRSEDDQIRALLQKFDLDPEKYSVKADLVDEDSVAAMVEFIKSNFDSVSCLLNVAGSSSNGMSWKLSKKEFVQVFEDNVLSAFLCCKQVIPAMRENKFGRIVNFSSVTGFTGIAGASHYAAAKAGLVGLTKSMALELAPKGITVNAIALGYFNAGLISAVSPEMQLEVQKKIPLARFGIEQDVGAAVSYLLSAESQFYTGQVMHLNGGQF